MTSTLPNLPRILKKKEADITPLVLRWFAYNWPNNVAIEVKIKGNNVLEHQDIALKQVQDGLFFHKIADTGRRNPFDGFVLKDADAFVVTCEGRNCVAVGYNGKTFKIKI